MDAVRPTCHTSNVARYLIIATCPHCGSQDDVDQREEVFKCRYCGSEYAVVEDVLPSGNPWPRQQEQPPPPPSVAVPPGVAPVSKPVGPFALTCLILVGMGTLGGGVCVGLIGRSVRPPHVRGTHGSYFDDAADVPRILGPKLGIGLARELTIHSKYAQLEVYHPTSIQRHTLRDGTVEDHAISSRLTPPPAEQLFRIDNVDFRRVPAIARDARRRAHVDHGTVTKIVLSRAHPGHRLGWTVSVSGAKRVVTLAYDLTGHLLSIHH